MNRTRSRSLVTVPLVSSGSGAAPRERLEGMVQELPELRCRKVVGLNSSCCAAEYALKYVYSRYWHRIRLSCDLDHAAMGFPSA